MKNPIELSDNMFPVEQPVEEMISQLEETLNCVKESIINYGEPNTRQLDWYDNAVLIAVAHTIKHLGGSLPSERHADAEKRITTPSDTRTGEVTHKDLVKLSNAFNKFSQTFAEVGDKRVLVAQEYSAFMTVALLTGVVACMLQQTWGGRTETATDHKAQSLNEMLRQIYGQGEIPPAALN